MKLYFIYRMTEKPARIIRNAAQQGHSGDTLISLTFQLPSSPVSLK